MKKIIEAISYIVLYVVGFVLSIIILFYLGFVLLGIFGLIALVIVLLSVIGLITDIIDGIKKFTNKVFKKDTQQALIKTNFNEDKLE